ATTSTAAGDSDYNLFLTKHSPSGNLLWFKTIGNNYAQLSACVRIGPANEVYFTGTFYQKTDFDPTTAVDTLNSAGKAGCFISQYDASGNYISTRLLEGVQIISDIVFRPNGEILVTGYTGGSLADVDFSGSVYSLSIPAYAQHAFVLRYTSSWGFLNAFSFGGAGLTPAFQDVNYSYDIALDTNAVIVSGGFRGKCDFDPGIGNTNDSTATTSGADYDMYFAKYDFNGTLIWKRTFGSTGGDYICNTQVLNGNIYVAARFEGTIDMDPSGSTNNVVSNASNDILFGRYDSNGNLLWIKSFGGDASAEYASHISLQNDNIVLSGISYSLALSGHGFDIDPGTGIDSIKSTNYSCPFAARYDLAGNYVASLNIDSTSYGYHCGHTCVGNAVYLAGYYKVNANFDPGFSNYAVASAGQDDAYLAKYEWTSSAIADHASLPELNCFPNPTNGDLIISVSTRMHTIRVTDLSGKVVLNITGINATSASLDLEKLTNGVYIMQVLTQTGTVSTRIIKQ
ncbi:MAG TPA: T9SS type A sorting domain-containing protein, partial [Flavobacteriales bacterium]|nr:T9SS type A sorting domain-containing protein [Flavobacteriales bacterium]